MIQVYFKQGDKLRQIAVDTDDAEQAQKEVQLALYEENPKHRGAVLAVVK